MRTTDMVDEQEIERLVEVARQASQLAYCPYSHFRVGAVVVTESGGEYIGCNIENASYGLTVCAERNAVSQMVMRRDSQIRMVVIYTPTDRPTAPCGACRQVLNEFAQNARVVSACDGPNRIDVSLSSLLPQAFGPHNLHL